MPAALLLAAALALPTPPPPVNIPSCDAVVGSKAVLAPDTIVGAHALFLAQRIEQGSSDIIETIVVRALPPFDHLHTGSKIITWADSSQLHMVGGVVSTVRPGAPDPSGSPTVMLVMDLTKTIRGDVFTRLDLQQTDTDLGAAPTLCHD